MTLGAGFLLAEPDQLLLDRLAMSRVALLVDTASSYAAGFSDGLADGIGRGFATGYLDGLYAEEPSASADSRDRPDGYAAGYAAGYADAFGSSYAAGYLDGPGVDEVPSLEARVPDAATPVVYAAPPATPGADDDGGYDAGFTDALAIGFVSGSASGGSSTPAAVAAPVVTVVTPLPPATSTTPIVVTVAGGAGLPLRRMWIDVSLPGVVGTEVVHNGTRFGAFYTAGVNARASITNGYQVTFLRDGGWPEGAFPVASSLTINAVDTAGNGT